MTKIIFKDVIDNGNFINYDDIIREYKNNDNGNLLSQLKIYKDLVRLKTVNEFLELEKLFDEPIKWLFTDDLFEPTLENAKYIIDNYPKMLSRYSTTTCYTAITYLNRAANGEFKKFLNDKSILDLINKRRSCFALKTVSNFLNEEAFNYIISIAPGDVGSICGSDRFDIQLKAINNMSVNDIYNNIDNFQVIEEMIVKNKYEYFEKLNETAKRCMIKSAYVCATYPNEIFVYNEFYEKCYKKFLAFCMENYEDLSKRSIFELKLNHDELEYIKASYMPF